jgi:hypothetical protein
MTSPMRRVRLAVLALLVACASAAPAVHFSSAWPDKPAGYGEATRRWSREASTYDGVDHVITVRATAKSPEWRAAYVEERTRRLGLTAEERAGLEETEKTAADASWEFELLIATHKNDWNDFNKWPKSMWRVALVGDDGQEVLPVKIELDRRVRDEIASWFPGYEPFYKAYTVSFPRAGADGKPLVGDGGKRLTLRVSSAIGAVELVWLGE